MVDSRLIWADRFSALFRPTVYLENLSRLFVLLLIDLEGKLIKLDRC